MTDQPTSRNAARAARRRNTVQQLARDVISMAQSGSMPDTYWLSDSRIARACKALGITPEEARDMEFGDD